MTFRQPRKMPHHLRPTSLTVEPKQWWKDYLSNRASALELAGGCFWHLFIYILSLLSPWLYAVTLQQPWVNLRRTYVCTCLQRIIKTGFAIWQRSTCDVTELAQAPPPQSPLSVCPTHLCMHVRMHTPVDSTESITVCGILVRLSPQQHLGTLTVVPLGCQHKHWLVVSLEQGRGRGRGWNGPGGREIFN